MIGLETIAIPTLFTLASYGQCENKPAPRVITKVTADRTVINTKKTHEELASFDIDTISPYGSSVHTKVGGLASTNIEVSTSSAIQWSTNTRTKTACMWYKEITIKIHSSPTIYIANESQKNRCRYNATLKHERKHVNVDKQIVTKYTPVFKRDVQRYVKQVGTVGPISESDIKAAQADLNAQIQRVVQNVVDKLEIERRERQQKVDSREEYDRLSRMCGGR